MAAGVVGGLGFSLVRCLAPVAAVEVGADQVVAGVVAASVAAAGVGVAASVVGLAVEVPVAAVRVAAGNPHNSPGIRALAIVQYVKTIIIDFGLIGTAFIRDLLWPNLRFLLVSAHTNKHDG